VDGRSPDGRAYSRTVRAIAVLGALLFAYLAVIPAALVGATLDPGCESCGSSAPVAAYFVIAFAACAVALGAVAVSMVAFAARPSRTSAARVGLALRISATVVGVLLLSEFAAAYPLAAAVIVPVCLSAVWLITLGRPPRAGTRRAPG
jgi:hypothetical protein